MGVDWKRMLLGIGTGGLSELFEGDTAKKLFLYGDPLGPVQLGNLLTKGKNENSSDSWGDILQTAVTGGLAGLGAWLGGSAAYGAYGGFGGGAAATVPGLTSSAPYAPGAASVGPYAAAEPAATGAYIPGAAGPGPYALDGGASTVTPAGFDWGGALQKGGSQGLQQAVAGMNEQEKADALARMQAQRAIAGEPGGGARPTFATPQFDVADEIIRGVQTRTRRGVPGLGG